MGPKSWLYLRNACRLAAEQHDRMENKHALAQGYAWAEDKEHCEEYGRMLSADPTKVSQRAKKRGLPQVAYPVLHIPLLPAKGVLAQHGLWRSHACIGG